MILAHLEAGTLPVVPPLSDDDDGLRCGTVGVSGEVHTLFVFMGKGVGDRVFLDFARLRIVGVNDFADHDQQIATSLMNTSPSGVETVVSSEKL